MSTWHGSGLSASSSARESQQESTTIKALKPIFGPVLQLPGRASAGLGSGAEQWCSLHWPHRNLLISMSIWGHLDGQHPAKKKSRNPRWLTSFQNPQSPAGLLHGFLGSAGPSAGNCHAGAQLWVKDLDTRPENIHLHQHALTDPD